MTRLVARSALLELSRRRSALGLIVALPLAFYLVQLDTIWTAVRLLGMGLGWGVATLALFTHAGSRTLDQRLVVAGATPWRVHLGRQLAVTAAGTLLAVVYFALVVLTRHHSLTRLWPVLLLLLVTAWIAAPLGALVAMLMPRDLEGALLLLGIMAIQVLVDPSDSWTKVLPMWNAREIATYAVQAVDTSYLAKGILHASIALAALTVAAALTAHTRLRQHSARQPTTL